MSNPCLKQANKQQTDRHGMHVQFATAYLAQNHHDYS